MQVSVSDALNPLHDRAVGLRLAKLRDDVGVEQIHRAHRNRVGVRRRARPLAGASDSARLWFDSNSSLSEGCAAALSRRHSWAGTKTAASLPRRVTICGPSVRHLSKNSLNRALASCTGHECM